jgi:cell division protein FtsI/penicillin-binding protein 2
MMGSSKVRAWVACFGLAVCFTGFSWRLVYLQVSKHDEYSALAAEKHVNKQIIQARRGLIQDVNREPLAANEPVQTVIADGSLINDAAGIAELLAGPLEMDSRELEKRLRTDRRYVVLKKRVPENVAKQLANRLRVRSLRGISFEQDSVRFYPNGRMLCHVLGFMNAGHEGVQGIERTMDDYLRGRDGFRFTERDRTGKELVLYRGQERPARDGCNVRLTIDMCLQNIVETELDAACAQFKPKGAVVILMRPKTGEILAMANRPHFDANQPGEGQGEQMKNAAIIDMVEPGSTFKIVTAAGALNERVVRLDSTIFCENGYYNVAGRPLRDHHGYGELTVEDVLVKSSNIGAAKIAMQLGEQRLYEYIRRFGFGERTGIALPGEISGLVHPPHRWSKISITRIPMGHEVGVTPIQIVAAMAAIANGGKLMLPQIIHEIVDGDGAPVATFPPVEIRQVVSPATAKMVTTALKGVVGAHGTAALARVNGYSVAGKTGTAQKVDPKGGYAPGKYVVSFAGFMPADDPQIVALVMLDDATTKAGENYGGLVAAPIFSRIGEKAARYLNLTPEPEPLPGTIILTQSGTHSPGQDD